MNGESAQKRWGSIQILNSLRQKMRDAGIPSYGQLLSHQRRDESAEIKRLRALPEAKMAGEWSALIDRLEELTHERYERD